MSEARLDRIEKRLDSIDDNLERHMKRSDALEAQTKPVIELMTELKGAIRFVKSFGIIIGIAVSILEFVRYIK